MKTSNKILLVAILIFFGTLLAYNIRIKAEYLSAKKNFSKYEVSRRFDNYEKVNVAAFDKVDIRTNLNVAVEYGPTPQIWIKRNGKGMVALTSKNGILSVDLTAKGRKEDYFDWNNGSITIINPKLSTLHIVRDQNTTHWRSNDIDVDRFNLDSLNVINTSPGTTLTLHKNSIASLNVLLGDRVMDTDLKFNLGEKNDIKNLKLKAFGRSRITLDNKVQNLSYDVSDNCTVSVRGAYLSKF